MDLGLYPVVNKCGHTFILSYSENFYINIDKLKKIRTCY